MRKVAVFVEGQTELIFVRGFLLEWFEYQIKLECRNLLTENNLHNAGHSFENPLAKIHVLLFNVGMDENVLARILDREQELYNSGFEVIVGLRDMYSEKYKKEAKTQRVDIDLTEKFRQNTAKTIQQRARQPGSIKFCYAVMELEAWWLGVPTLWENLDSGLREQHQNEFLMPESVFHPAGFIRILLQSQQKTYKKHKSEVESIVGKITREDYLDLHSSQRCPSFCEFVQYIQPHENNA